MAFQVVIFQQNVFNPIEQRELTMPWALLYDYDLEQALAYLATDESAAGVAKLFSSIEEAENWLAVRQLREDSWPEVTYIWLEA